MSDIERELEQELHRVLDPIAAMPAPLRRFPRRGGAKKQAGRAGAAVATKVLSGVVVAAVAVTIAGAARETVVTRSLNPGVWVHQAQQQASSGAKQHESAGGSQAGGSVAGHSSSGAKNPGATAQTGAGSANGGSAGSAGSGGSASKGQDTGVPGAGSGREPADPAGTHPPASITPAP